MPLPAPRAVVIGARARFLCSSSSHKMCSSPNDVSLATPPRGRPSADGGVLPFLIVRPSQHACINGKPAFASSLVCSHCKRVLDQQDWESVVPDGLHPGTTSPMGCELVALDISHPDPPMIKMFLSRIGMTEVNVEHGDSPSLSLKMDTPKGLVEIKEVDFSEFNGKTKL